MSDTVQSIKADATAAAIEAGYYYDDDGDFRASLGRFEAEPWYVPYFYDQVMNGDGETYYSGEQADCDVLDVDDNERAAFNLEPDTVAVAVTYSDQGFIGLVELSAAKRAQLEADYAADDSDDTDY